MSKSFYFKLAASNMKKNKQTYFPYILACTVSVAMYYIIYMMSINKGLESMPGSESLKLFLDYGRYVIMIFAVIFLFYTNSFLMKRRKKEFGLFNILGMEKRHIGKMMFIETLYTAVISLGTGLLSGMLFSKLMYLLMARLLHYSIPLKFEISGAGMLNTITLFGVIFVLTLLNGLRQVHLVNPVELLRGGNVGEREPKTKWFLALFGVLCLAGGYYISLTTENPLAAVLLFFVAVVLVMIGTYCLFTAVSIVVLKAMRKNKNFYYQKNHFTSVSGMIYRMKQNAVGLANICILSTIVLVVVSTTMSLYLGMNDLLRTRYPRNVVVESWYADEETSALIDTLIAETCAEEEMRQENIMKYSSYEMAVYKDGSRFYMPEAGEKVAMSEYCNVFILPLADYNRISGENKTLASNEVLLYYHDGYGNLEEKQMQMGDKTFKIKERINELELANNQLAMMIDSYFVIVPELADITPLYEKWYGDKEYAMGSKYSYQFDHTSDIKEDDALHFVEVLRDKLNAEDITVSVESAFQSKQSFYVLYGGFFFLGIFLGVVFLLATVLIIYYKQISEGYEDKARFEIMKKVGMSDAEVKSSIRSQVMTVFFLPLVVACIHCAFAFPIVKKLLLMFNLSNTTLFVYGLIGTAAVFAVFYGIIYAMTAKVYYKIVSTK